MKRCVADLSENGRLFPHYNLLTGLAAAAVGGAIGLIAADINATSTRKTNEANIKAQSEVNAANIAAQKEINAANIANQKEINQSQLDFAKAQTQAQWERDDSAHQREVADLEAAGLSPLAATGGAPTTPAQSYNPQMAIQEAPTISAARAQAPQVDANAIINSLVQGMALTERASEHQDKMIREDNSLSLQAERVTQAAQSLDIERSKVDNELLQITNNYSLGCQQIELANKELKENIHEHDTEYNKWLYKTVSENSLKIADACAQAAKEGHFNVIPITDYKDFNEAWKNYGKKLEAFLASKGISRSGEVSFQMGIKKAKNFDSSGFNLGGTWKPNSKREEILYKQFQAENPMPIYVFGYVDLSKYNFQAIYR